MTTTRRASTLNDPFLWASMLLVGATLTTLSVLQYRGYNAGMLDLGAMTQAILSVLRGQPLVTTGPTGNFSRLAGHFELIYFAFAPLLALWRDPQLLLLAQALLAVTGAIPAYRLALRRLDSVLAARCAALIYLLYPVAQSAVLFDFHGDTLAMPLLMFALEAVDRRAWWSFALWTALALSCKIYIAAPVASIGAYLFLWGGQRRSGLIIGAVALAYGATVFFFVRDLFAMHLVNQTAAATYTNYYFGDKTQLLATVPGRLMSALVVFGPALFLAWRGWRWLLVSLPLPAATLLSSGPGSGYHYDGHHYAALVPFLVMATLEGAARLRTEREAGRTSRLWPNDLIFTTMIVALCCILLVDQPLGLRFWLAAPGDGLDPSGYGQTVRDPIKDRFLATHVPPGKALAASIFLAAHLTDRDLLFTVRYPNDPGGQLLPALLPQVDYALADALFDWRLLDSVGTVLGGAAYEQKEIGILLRDPAFALVSARDGLLLFQRNAPANARLTQEITAETASGPLPAPIATFGPIALLKAEVRHVEGRRYSASFSWTATEALPKNRDFIAVSRLQGVDSASFSWTATEALPKNRDFIAVSRLQGVEGARIVHLPSFALMPTSAWHPGDLINEHFELELPEELSPGSFSWQVAWYDPAHPEAYATDPASLLSGSQPVNIAVIEVAP